MPVKSTSNFNIKKALIFLGIAAFFILAYLFLTNKQSLSAFKIISNFVSAPIDEVKSSNGRTNILVMGKAGKEHAGEDLTDTMILVSVSLQKPSIVLISIPRDLWIPELRTKINSTYHYGGINLAKSSVEEVLGVPVNYGVTLDFSGFKDIVDVLGGINVNVENSFTDTLYPIAGRENDLCGGDPEFKCRYETISFNAGNQLMDGETALKFVRSRHSEGTEGTDLAREARQQKVIDAIENKILTPSTLLNPQKDLTMFRVIMSSLETDMDATTGAIIARKAFDGRRSITKFLIPDDLLVNPPTSPTYDKQYVFIPKLGNGRWEDVKSWASGVLK
jgi:anionic cell wall polymer biosynthesis LytR-Cps2A-Psr (LCP) family protein